MTTERLRPRPNYMKPTSEMWKRWDPNSLTAIWSPRGDWPALVRPAEWVWLRDRAGLIRLSRPGEARLWLWPDDLSGQSLHDIVAYQLPIGSRRYRERHGPRLAMERAAREAQEATQRAAEKAEAKAERARHRPLPDNQLRAYVLEQLDWLDEAARIDPERFAAALAAMRATINGKPPE